MLLRLPSALRTLLSLAAVVVAVFHRPQLVLSSALSLGPPLASVVLPEYLSKEKALASLVAEGNIRGKVDAIGANISISVYFNAIYANKTIAGGYLS